MKMSVSFVLTAMVLIAFSAVSFSQTPSESGPPPAARWKEITPENFNEAKAAALQRIEGRMRLLSREKACIEAATNAEEMKTCAPGRPERMGSKRMQERQQ